MADRVFLVFAARSLSGKGYFRRLRELGNGDRNSVPRTVPELDDDISQAIAFSPELAVTSRDLFRNQGLDVWIEDGAGNRLFDREQTESATERFVNHEVRFVRLAGGGVDGKGYHVRFSPERHQWYCRAIDIPSMVAEHRDRETLWADTPESVVTKILELWSITIAIPFDDPEAIAEKERQQVIKNKNYIPGLRPADR